MNDTKRARCALELAAELNKAARSVPTRVEYLLDAIEPPIGDLRGLMITDPRRATEILRTVTERSTRPEIQKAVARLISDDELHNLVIKSRAEMLKFVEDCATWEESERSAREDEVRTGLRAIRDRWPVSRFVEGLVSDEIDSMFRLTLGDGRWLVPVLEEDDHRQARELLEVRYGFRREAVSPLRAWLLCPKACRDCWFRLKDRMREAIGLLPAEGMTQKGVAEMLEVRSSTVGRWAAGDRTPPWWDGTTEELQQLLEKKGGRYLRADIEELAKKKRDFGSQ